MAPRRVRAVFPIHHVLLKSLVSVEAELTTISRCYHAHHPHTRRVLLARPHILHHSGRPIYAPASPTCLISVIPGVCVFERGSCSTVTTSDETRGIVKLVMSQ